MLDFLSGRLKERKAARIALIHQESEKAQRLDQIKAMVGLMKELLRDQRYAPYTQLLSEARASLLSEREVLLREETDRDAREHQAAIITGRIMQLDFILTTPEQFLRLAEQPEANGSAARPPAREPVR